MADARDNFSALRDQTRAALAAERAAGRPEPDLVAWGESMLYVPLFEADQSFTWTVERRSSHGVDAADFLLVNILSLVVVLFAANLLAELDRG